MNDFNYYPEIIDPKFEQKLYLKKEFNKYKATAVNEDDSDIDELCTQKKTDFELLRHQKILRTYISPHSPYNGLLIIHGTGSGKTCSAISIAESFIKNMETIYKTSGGSGGNSGIPHVYIVSNGSARYNFLKELMTGCGEIEGRSYASNEEVLLLDKYRKMGERGDIPYKKLLNETIMKRINKPENGGFYTFLGYREFQNKILGSKVKNISGKNIKKDGEILRKISPDIIDNMNNSLLIIDEVHNIEGNDWGTATELIIKKSVGLKILLLSATAMQHRASEIIQILNLLKVPGEENLKRTKIFNIHGIGEGKGIGKGTSGIEGESISKENLELIGKFSRGKISYLESGNDPSFPTIIEEGKILPGFKFTKLIPCVMTKHQVSIYKKKFNDLLSDRYVLDMVLPAYPEGYIYQKYDIYKNYGNAPKKWLQEKGIIFNALSEEEKKQSGDDSKLFTIKGSILKIDNLSAYSNKFVQLYKNIIRSFKINYGSIFIYNEWTTGIGLDIIAEILSENGIEKYDVNKSSEVNIDTYNKNTLCISCGERYHTYKNHEYIPAKYIVLDGSVVVNVRTKIIDLINDIDNIDGKHIKIILGSRVVRESVDFKRIREIHIVNFQNNYPTIDQIIGRAVRHCSHVGLPTNEQNVKIFKYVSILSTGDVNDKKKLFESVEIKKYYEGEYNYILIKNVEKQLKINAFDCELNKNANIIKTRSNSDICDYIDCSYKCSGDVVDTKIVDTDTFDAYYLDSDIKVIKKLIKKLFKSNIIYTYDDLYDSIVDDLDKNMYSDESFIIALNQMVENQEFITNEFNNFGFIIYKYPYYVFQPIYNKNTEISLFDRLLPDIKKYDSSSVKINKFILDNIVEKDIDAKLIWKKLQEMPVESYENIIEIEKYLEKFKLENQVKILERAIEEYNNNILRNTDIKTIIDIILDYYDKYLLFVDDLTENNYSLSSSLESTLSSESIRNEYIVAHILDKHIKCWNPDSNGWEHCQKNKKDKSVVIPNEVGKWIGYMDKDNKGKLIFKIRPPLNKDIIKKYKDRRKIEFGFVCSQSNDKERIKNIAIDIGIAIHSIKSIKDLCTMIENRLRYLEKEHKNKQKWFYEYIERMGSS